MDLSIIIISYNTSAITKTCLDTLVQSLSHSDLRVEILVIDNGSADNSLEMLQGYKKNIRNKNIELNVIESKENLGFVKANNLGAKKAKAKTLLLLNSDIEILDNAIEKLYFFYQNQDVFQFVGAKLFNKDMSPQASAGPEYTLFNMFLFLFLQGDRFGITRNSPNHLTEVAWVSGAAFMTTKEYFNELHGFDEGIFMYMEEIDLFYRARKHHYKIGFYPDSHLIHLGSASSKGRTQPILQVYKGYLYYYKKHFSQRELMILKNMLKLKARISIFIGYVLKFLNRTSRSEYLIKTYEEGYRIAENY